MNKTFLALAILLLANYHLAFSKTCNVGSFLNSQGECQCNVAGKYLENIGVQLPNLEETLNILQSEYSNITSQVPFIYNFNEGEGGNWIQDGGDDMYDNGNMLTTNLALGGYLPYTNKYIAQNGYLGTNGQYYTVKYPGLFVFVADINISEFTITGGNGADGYGSLDGAVLSKTFNGVPYKGFVKRVYGTTDPSINHLVIVPDNGVVSHTFPSDTNSDLHTISGLQGVRRIYYLLFANKNGSASTKIEDSIMEQIMTTFMNMMSSIERCTGNCPNVGGCLACVSPSQCRKCTPTMTLVDGVCQSLPCPAGTFLNSDGECQCSTSASS